MTDAIGRMEARKEGAIGWMVFDNPLRRNAVSLAMWRAIPEILADFAADPAIRLVVLTGAGDQAFVSGADISEFDKERSSAAKVAAYNATAGAANQALAGFAKPTLAMIRGYCIGGGLGIALACDLRFAAEEASFAIPAARLGLGYNHPAVKRLIDVVGVANALEVLFTARRFSAAEAERMRLVNRVLPYAEIESFVRNCADQIASNAPLTLSAAKICARELLKNSAEQDIAACDAAVAACFASSDYAEGRAAFAEKRRPIFHGR